MSEVTALNKRVFIQQYVLNRARAKSDSGLNGVVVAQEAVKAWDYIQEQCEVKVEEK
jgi:hypothetical protein